MAAEAVEESGATNKAAAESQCALERDFCRLTIEQAEIERVHEERGRLGYMENAGGYGENEESVGGKSWDAARFRRCSRKRISYPTSPDTTNCKFNHTWRKNQGVKGRGNFNKEKAQRAGAGHTECKYYLTSGGCKYGMHCRFSHGSDKSSKSSFLDFNLLGLPPIRQGEKQCPYFMRTRTCKFGTSARFHHRDYSSRYGNDGCLSSWSSPRAFNETHALFSQIEGAPNNYYQIYLSTSPTTGTCKYGISCGFHHPEPTIMVGADYFCGSFTHSLFSQT